MLFGVTKFKIVHTKGPIISKSGLGIGQIGTFIRKFW